MLFGLLGQGFAPFFAPEGEAGGVATPSSNEGASSGQASEQPGAGSENFSNVDPSKLPPELQSIYKNMQGDYTRKMQEFAPYRKTLEQFQGLTPDQLREQIELARSIQENPQSAVEDYIQQNPQALGTLFQKYGPQAMMQAFQQPQQNPYAELANISDPVEYAQKTVEIAKAQILSEIQGEVNPIKQTLQKQEESAIKSGADAIIDERLKGLPPDCGVTKEAVWKFIAGNNIPIKMLQIQPGLLDMAILQTAGGFQKYNELIGNARIKNYQTEIQSNHNSTAALPSSGVSVQESQVPIMDARKLSRAAHDALNARVAAGG